MATPYITQNPVFDKRIKQFYKRIRLDDNKRHYFGLGKDPEKAKDKLRYLLNLRDDNLLTVETKKQVLEKLEECEKLRRSLPDWVLNSPHLKENTDPKRYVYFAWSVSWGSEMWSQAVTRAKKKNLEFTLTKKELNQIIERSNNRCEVTGIPFDFDFNPSVKKGAKRPFIPSLDRIDSSLGYSFENCRLVVYCVNASLLTWGEEVFTRMITNAYHYKKMVGDKPTEEVTK